MRLYTKEKLIEIGKSLREREEERAIYNKAVEMLISAHEAEFQKCLVDAQKELLTLEK